MSKDQENIENKKRMNDISSLKEADKRRKAKEEKIIQKEYDGRDGPEPTRYDDWEKSGIVSDF